MRNVNVYRIEACLIIIVTIIIIMFIGMLITGCTVVDLHGYRLVEFENKCVTASGDDIADCKTGKVYKIERDE